GYPTGWLQATVGVARRRGSARPWPWRSGLARVVEMIAEACRLAGSHPILPPPLLSLCARSPPSPVRHARLASRDHTEGAGEGPGSCSMTIISGVPWIAITLGRGVVTLLRCLALFCSTSAAARRLPGKVVGSQLVITPAAIDNNAFGSVGQRRSFINLLQASRRS